MSVIIHYLSSPILCHSLFSIISNCMSIPSLSVIPHYLLFPIYLSPFTIISHFMSFPLPTILYCLPFTIVCHTHLLFPISYNSPLSIIYNCLSVYFPLSIIPHCLSFILLSDILQCLSFTICFHFYCLLFTIVCHTPLSVISIVIPHYLSFPIVCNSHCMSFTHFCHSPSSGIIPHLCYSPLFIISNFLLSLNAIVLRPYAVAVICHSCGLFFTNGLSFSTVCHSPFAVIPHCMSFSLPVIHHHLLFPLPVIHHC